jgi:hypothetical protein
MVFEGGVGVVLVVDVWLGGILGFKVRYLSAVVVIVRDMEGAGCGGLEVELCGRMV